MPDLAAQTDGEGLAGLAPAAAVAGDGAGGPQVALPVGHGGDLDVDAAGRGEGLVDVPQRAGAAGAGEVESGRGLPLGHVARPVHPDEREGDPAQPGALQGAEAVADRLVPQAEPVGEPLDVVTELLRGGVERPVREDQRGGEVVGDADPGQPVRRGSGREVLRREPVQLACVLQERELGGHPERLLARPQPCGQVQDTGGVVVVVQPFGVGGHADAVVVGQARRQGPDDLPGPDAKSTGQVLCGEVDVVEVVLAAVEELPDLLVRRARATGPRQPLPVAVGAGQPFGEELAAPAEVEEHLGDGGHPGCQLRQVRGRDPRFGHLAGQRLAQVRDQAARVPLREEAGVDPERLGEPQQYGHRQRAGVVFHLVQVAGRNGQDPGQVGLAHPALLAQPPQPRARIRLAHRVVSLVAGTGLTLRTLPSPGVFADLANGREKIRRT